MDSTAPASSPDAHRAAIARLWRADEARCVPPLLEAASVTSEQRVRIERLAQRLIDGLRSHERGGVEALMRSLPLTSAGGLALLSLAEALLRVPDSDNANRLIRDRIGGTDWQQFAGGAGWGLALSAAAALVGDPRSTPGPIARSVQRAAMPLVRAGIRLSLRALSGRFIFSQDIESALRRAGARRQRQYRYSFDMLGEAALTAADAERYYAAYERAIHAVGRVYRGRGPKAGGSVSVKLSALHPRYSYTQQPRVMRELLPRLARLATLAREYDIGLAIDAEESERLELSLELIEALLGMPTLRGWHGLAVAVQAYQKRAPAVIDYLAALGARNGAPLMVRLVKGAYWDSEIKWAQMEGLAGFPVYSRKLHTDVAYLACARRLLAASDRLWPQFATHNAQTVASIIELGGDADSGSYEFQCLYGMGSGLYRQVLSGGRPVRVYAPVGSRATLLAYLMRRLLENGAATSFVHQVSARGARTDALAADPVARAAVGAIQPHAQIRLPRQLYAPERLNSAGVDLADVTARAPLLQALAHARQATLDIGPLVAVGAECVSASEPRAIRNPANRVEVLGTVTDADEALLQAALAAATDAARAWAETEIEQRAALLQRAADLYEQHLPQLVALAVREAGKTLANGIGEVREAVDYLRYYAAQISAQFDRATHVPLGVVACISPWNFPLAIFTGQVAAALAAGNVVIAKPAEQTSAMAHRAVQLLHQAGVPRAALQLLPGDGEQVGAKLVADARVGGVVFTGSTAAARAIARSLANRGDVPLIAETGGQNAMIVDSTALPEQVVSDVLRSSFDSAGQRCSALRVLCLQHEIADTILEMLQGALKELQLGDPEQLSTDVGPLIDEVSKARIERYLAAHADRVLARAPLPGPCASGVFIAPTLLRIDSIDELDGEVFGPVLHVLRYSRAQLPALMAAINASGYALTLGVATRIHGTADQIIERAHAGNIYVNRNMIGAVVGLQPFGGHGLSGTGPKAGGPLYLQRLCAQTPGPQWASMTPQPPPRLLRQLRHWIAEADTGLSAAQCQRLLRQIEYYCDRPLLQAQMSLHGYVGESDQLTLRARATLRATAQSIATLLSQLAAALASGSNLCADSAELASTLRAILPAALRTQLLSAPASYDVVLVDGTEARLAPQWFHELCKQCAQLDGPIIAVVVGEEGYALERLLLEQTVSTNTAAVGGDARLLALDDG